MKRRVTSDLASTFSDKEETEEIKKITQRMGSRNLKGCAGGVITNDTP